MDADALLAFRPEFPILENTTYLIFTAIDDVRASGACSDGWTGRRS